MNQPIKPLLRWAGSKRQLLRKFEPLFPKVFDTYHEPFAGSACVYFHLKPQKSILSDVNLELIEALTFLRDSPESLIEELKSLEKTEETYYRIRAQKPNSLDKAKRTARFIFLNRFCFNGLYRTNLKGEFNVPYAPQKSGTLPSDEQIMIYSKLLQCAELHCDDFEKSLERVSKNDFIYLDPPFHVTTRRVFREYDRGGFTRDDLSRLAGLLVEIDKRGAKFMLSYAYGKDASEFFGRWDSRRLITTRNIAGFAKNRRRVAEAVLRNYESE